VPIDDAVELSELLEFICDWLTSAPRIVRCDLERFVGAEDYSIDELRATLSGWSARLLRLRPGRGAR
jgi:hypothetical protein